MARPLHVVPCQAFSHDKVVRLPANPQVLVVKLLAMSLGIAAGLPLGKDGPNVHIAACSLSQTVAGINLSAAICCDYHTHLGMTISNNRSLIHL